LPKYRGAAPIAWAIYHGEKQTGVTIIQMTPQLDAGGTIAQEAVEIGPEETAGELEARLAPLGAKLALESIEKIVSGTAKPLPQDKSQVSKAPKLKKEDGLIDWSRNADQVCNQIRAMQPWPTAYTFLHREGQVPIRVIIHRACPISDPFFPANRGIDPGGWLFRDSLHHPDWLLVYPGEKSSYLNTVGIYELQPAGKRRMPAAEFLRGHPIREGDRFGPEQP